MEENKKNKIPNVPNLRFKDWADSYEKKCFYDVVSITNGQVDPNDERYRLLPHIGPGNIEKETGVLLDYNLAYQDNLISSKYLFDETCVVYGKINPHFAKATYPGFVGLCSADAYPLKPLHGVDSYYLLQLVLSKRFTKYTTSVSKRTGMPKVNRDDLALYRFYLPSYEEQKKVGEFIRKIDARIATQNKIIDKLESLRIQIKERIFDLGSIKRTISDVLLENNKKSVIQDQYPVLSSTVKGLFLQSDYFDREVASSNNVGYKIVKKGQIIISPQNLWMGNITYNNLFECGIVSPSYKVFDINEKYSKSYIFWLLTSKHSFFNYALVSEQGASIVRRNLNYDSFLNISLPLCNEEQQKHISKLIDSIEAKLKMEKRKLELFLNQKNYFLSNLFI